MSKVGLHIHEMTKPWTWAKTPWDSTGAFYLILLVRFSCLFDCTWAHILGISPSPLRDKYILTCSFLAQVPYESLLSALNGTGIHPTHTPSPPPSTHPQMARIAVANLNLGANKAQVSFGGWRSWCTSGDGTPIIIQAFRLKANVKKMLIEVWPCIFWFYKTRWIITTTTPSTTTEESFGSLIDSLSIVSVCSGVRTCLQTVKSRISPFSNETSLSSNEVHWQSQLTLPNTWMLC